LAIANSLALVATFAGAFTYNSLVTLKSQSTGGTTEKFGSQSTLLSVSFILYTLSLFVTIFIQLILRQSDPDNPLTEKPQIVMRVSFFLVAGLIIAGFILLYITLIGFGQRAVAGVGIGLVGVSGVILILVGCCCDCTGNCRKPKQRGVEQRGDERGEVEQGMAGGIMLRDQDGRNRETDSSPAIRSSGT
jgi:hypothetical protein